MILLVTFSLYSSSHILVKVDDPLILKDLTIEKHLFDNWYSVKIPGKEEPLRYAKKLKKTKGIIDASPDYIFHALMIPNDEYYQYQWNLRKYIRLEEAWDISGGGSRDVIVGIIDTGCSFEEYPVPNYEQAHVNGTSYHIYDDYNPSTFVKGYDFVNDDEHPNDDNGHGTMVSGVIAEATNNGRGLAGIAYNVRILPVKVLDYQGNGYISDIARGIIYATKNGARVINLSLGSSESSSILEDAVNFAVNNDVVLVAASGNDGANGVYYPAAYPGVIAVGAYDSLGNLATYSNYGPEIDILGPGGDVTFSDSMYVYQQCFLPYSDEYNLANLDEVNYYGMIGTSLACPHITALCALILSVAQELNPDDVKSIIYNTAKDFGPPGWDIYSGYGIPDFKEAVNTAYFISHFESLNDVISVTYEIDGDTLKGASVISSGPFTITQRSSYTLPIALKLINEAGQVVDTFTINGTYYLNIEKSGVYFLYSSGRAGIKLIVVK